MIGIETSATERIALARELAAVRRDQYRRSRAEAVSPRPGGLRRRRGRRGSAPAPRAVRERRRRRAPTTGARAAVSRRARPPSSNGVRAGSGRRGRPGWWARREAETEPDG